MTQVTIIQPMLGKVFKEVSRTGPDARDDVVYFYCTDGESFRMHHEQDCCESVYLQDVCGDLQDLVGAPILEAEEISFGKGEEDKVNPALLMYLSADTIEDSYTWTFYKFSTIKGSVVLRWYGVSNGYYSESVSIEYVKHASKRSKQS